MNGKGKWTGETNTVWEWQVCQPNIKIVNKKAESKL